MKAYSIDLRQKIIEAYQNCEGSQRDLAKRFKVSLYFIQKLLKQYRDSGTLAPRPRGKGFPPKLAQHIHIVEKLLEEKNDATLKELQICLEQEIGVKLSISSICRFLQQLKLTRKKTLKTTQAGTPRVQHQRFEYWKLIKNIDVNNLVFIDEMGANLSLHRKFARSFKGTRAYSLAPFYPGLSISLIGALSLKGFLGGMTLDGGTNGTAFQVFLEQVLLPELWPGACVVMDNLPAHKVQGVRQKIESVGASLIYLSPYSPDFNPIENCWSKLKQHLRSVAARSRELLENAISSGLDLITPQDIQGWFTHCCYCTS